MALKAQNNTKIALTAELPVPPSAATHPAASGK